MANPKRLVEMLEVIWEPGECDEAALEAAFAMLFRPIAKPDDSDASRKTLTNGLREL